MKPCEVDECTVEVHGCCGCSCSNCEPEHCSDGAAHTAPCEEHFWSHEVAS